MNNKLNKKSVLLIQRLLYPSSMGGPSKTLYDMACKWTNDGYDVSAIAAYEYIDDKRIIPNKWMLLSGFRVIYCTSLVYRINLRSFFTAIGNIGNFDTVVFSSFFYAINFPLVLYALIRKKNIIWSPRGETLAMKSAFKKTWVKLIRLLCSKKVTFHATTEFEYDNILRYLPNARIIVIPNLLDLPKCLTTTKNNNNYLLFVGRIAPIKALEKVIEAIHLSKVFQESNYMFLIAGPIEKQFQNYYLSLTQLISKYNLKNKIEFIGNKSGSDKDQIYHDAKSLILPSITENFGNVVVESLTQGTPVIASLDTPWSLLNTYNAGYYVSNEPKSLASTIEQLISLSKKEYTAMREAALKLGLKYSTVNMNQWYPYL